MKLIYGVFAAVLLGFCLMYIPNLLLQPATYSASPSSNNINIMTSGNTTQQYSHAFNITNYLNNSKASSNTSPLFQINGASGNFSTTNTNASVVQSNTSVQAAGQPALSQALVVPAVMLMTAFLVALVAYFAIRRQF